MIPADLDEDVLTVLDPWDTALSLALAKARAIARRRPDALVIGSDTVVAVDTGLEHPIQLAKPRDLEDGVRMLKLLSGREHVVITGVALVMGLMESASTDTTRVRFRNLSEVEIRDYMYTGEPMDKAGGYAIQGGAAGFVANTTGSLSNVVGLPLEQVQRMLKNLDFEPT